MYWLGFKNLATKETSYMENALYPYGRAVWATREEIEHSIRLMSMTSGGQLTPKSFEYVIEPVYKVGRRVFWTDPDDGKCSAYGTITRVQHEEVGEDTVISLVTDAGGEVEAFFHELRPIIVKVGFCFNLVGTVESVVAFLKKRGGVTSAVRPRITRELDDSWQKAGKNYVGPAHGGLAGYSAVYVEMKEQE